MDEDDNSYDEDSYDGDSYDGDVSDDHQTPIESIEEFHESLKLELQKDPSILNNPEVRTYVERNRSVFIEDPVAGEWIRSRDSLSNGSIAKNELGFNVDDLMRLMNEEEQVKKVDRTGNESFL